MTPEIKKPRRRVLHVTCYEGYRTGTRLHFVLECGHLTRRKESRGRPATIQCYSCWAIAECDAHGHPPYTKADKCWRCSKARAQLGTAAQQIASQKAAP